MEILRAVLYWMDPEIALLCAASLGAAVAFGLSGSLHDDDDLSGRGLMMVRLRRVFVLGIPAVLIISFFFLWQFGIRTFGLAGGNHYMGMLWKAAMNTPWWGLLTLFFSPILFRWYWLRFALPRISSWLREFRVTQSGDALSDIRIEVKNIKPKVFNPCDFYRAGMMFLGLDGTNQPIYMEDSEFKKNHLKYIGPSQTGKGIGMGTTLDQAIRKGWGAWFVDQKPDDFIYEIMRESCLAAGRPPPLVLDLNGIGPGDYGPFIHGSPRERRERVVKAFGLADSGTNADFYKRNERAVLDFLMPFWNGSLPELSAILTGAHPTCMRSDIAAKAAWIAENTGNISANVSEFLQLEALRSSPEQSFDVAAALQANSVVYIKGHMKDTIVRKALIALLDEVIQVALRQPIPGHTYMALDECRFMATDTLADSLATLLSKGINMGLAYQSVEDLRNLPDKSLNAASIKVAVETNTQVTISYRANDPETAEWVEAQTGIVQKTVSRMEKVEVNQAGGEQWTGERSVAATPEALIPGNKLIALPPRVAALIRPNKLAMLLYTCWVPVKEFQGLPARPHKPVAPLSSPLPGSSDLEPIPPSHADDMPEEEPFEAPMAPLPPKASSKRKFPNKKPATLTNDELAAIEAAAKLLAKKPGIPSPAEKTPTNPDQLNLSSIDDIEGI